MSEKRVALIIGAGPAGLTLAYELLKRTDYLPILFEATDQVGGIARTINYKGNRIDIGGHRFFSKSDRVMEWWSNILPLESSATSETAITYQRESRVLGDSYKKRADVQRTDRVMLVRNRLSRIYFLRKFFNYPITLDLSTLRNLGAVRVIKIGMSYVKTRLFPIRKEVSLADFFRNRFGDALYKIFFKDYTEKVWGVPCSEIPASWGAQRVKGLSIQKAIVHALRKMLKPSSLAPTISQKSTETSLIEKFLYPKLGPGQMWEEVASQITAQGAKILMKHSVVHICHAANRIGEVVVRDESTGAEKRFSGDIIFSTMPIRDLVQAMDNAEGKVPSPIRAVSDGLVYRDFITVGLLVTSLGISDRDRKNEPCSIRDNWIYIQEPDVKVGRLQIFNNWSPYLVKDPNTVWLGLEYFCQEGDSLWQMTDSALRTLGEEELIKIGILEEGAVVDGVVIRVPKTYPAYFGTYDKFDQIKNYLNGFENLYLLGRNGMHRYNNQDHSMLTAMVAVDNVVGGIRDKENIWNINTESEYHEEKSREPRASTPDRSASAQPISSAAAISYSIDDSDRYKRMPRERRRA